MDTDGSLEKAMNKVWKNMVGKRMYITGGIGSQGYAERFTVDNDLPVDRGYMETCASVGLCFWAKRLLELYRRAEYADVMERALYNSVLVGWSLSGEEYFYTNTLHYKKTVTDYREDSKHLENGRQRWFRCACCPSNILRLVTNIQDYCLIVDSTGIYVNLYLQGQWMFEKGGKSVAVIMRTEYPYDGNIIIRVQSGQEQMDFQLGLRIPQWCKNYEIILNGKRLENVGKKEDGYVVLDKTWKGEETVFLKLAMPAEYIFSDRAIWDSVGKTALARGPIIYCQESVDYGTEGLEGLFYDLKSEITYEDGDGPLAGLKVLKTEGYRLQKSSGEQAYSAALPKFQKCRITAIPYYAWRNRGESDMDVWFPYRI